MAAADRNRRLARSVATGGLLSALALFFLVLSALMPTLDLTLMTLSSLCVAIAVMEIGPRGGWLVYLAVSAIAWAWPGISFSYLFMAFFGPFPLIKAFSEKKWRQLPAAIFKLAVSAVLLGLSVFWFARPALSGFLERFGLPLLVLAAFVGLLIVLVYDYALSMLIILYSRRRPSTYR